MFLLRILLFLSIIHLNACLVFTPATRVKPIEFDYGPISKNYFNPDNEKPFPLTVQRGNNLYNSTTKDGRYLFYTTGQKGNYDIWFRDLRSSIVVPVTEHPSGEYKPAISPSGKKLVFVSEQYDSAGDIVLLEMEPSLWAKRILEGKRFLSQDFQFITNLEYEDPLKSDKFSDSDPSWGPDDRWIVFSSDRLSPGIPNLILWDTDGKEKPRLLTKDGATNPYWSSDGRTVVYLSYADTKEGEIYSLDLISGKTRRLTSDAYLDFSPSLSPDGKYLFYTSIRNDSDGNRKLDERDNSLIIRLDLSDSKERRISSGNFSLFDTKYSSFNGGSILFTASYYGTLNIYFLPLSGSVPKAEDIRSQFELAKEYGKKQSFEEYLFALDSVELYFKEDPLYPIFWAKVLKEKYQGAKRFGKQSLVSELRKELLSSRMDPRFGLGFAYYLEVENGISQQIRDYYSALKNVPNIDSQLIGAFSEELGILEEASGRADRALSLWEGILERNPKYYNIREVLRNIGSVQLRDAGKKGWLLSNTLIQASNRPDLKTEDLRNLYELFEDRIVTDISDSDKWNIADTIASANSIHTRSPVLDRFLIYVKALSYQRQGSFQQSNALLDPIMKDLKPLDPLFLKAHLVRSENFKGMGNVRNSLEEFKAFLENYDHSSGVKIDDKEMERFFIYFENLARNYENRSDFLQASLHYFYNTENMFLAKSKNLFLDTIYKDYAIYYQKLMVDTSFKLAKSVSEKSALGLLKNFNPLDYDPLDQKEGLFYINQYYEKEKILPRARTFLDLATLYGYAYYLINRSVIRETFYYASGTMDVIKKEAALRDYKQAEYELRWIIFADPTFHDAYQLLGWLYQYVDIIKSRRSGEKDDTDEEIYKKEYSKYFPEKNFEENIELYSQILELLGEGFANKKALSDLRLNLGNNYFLLKNYPKADEQYSLVESYSNYIISKAQFEDYRQRAVFLFNSARASMYMSNYSDAARKLKAADELYSKNEFPQVHSGPNSNTNLQSYREKLALIRTLIGLSYMEIGEYARAIPYYKEALELNEPSRFVDPINLRNALAICYQKLGNLSLSEENLREAENLNSQKGIRWFPRKVNPKFWDYFWDYVFEAVLPDSTRISGSGRFPEAIPSAFQPLLSSGIRVNNLVLEQNYTLAAEETNKRLEHIGNKGLRKTLAGLLAESQSLGELGFYDYRRGDFESAKKDFIAARDFEREKPELSGRSAASFKKYLYSLFAYIESSSSSKSGTEEELAFALQELESVKENAVEPCVSLWVEDPVEGRKRCEESFYKEYYDFDILRASLLFYSGEDDFQKGRWIEGFEKLGIAASLLESPSNLPKEIVGLSKDPFSRRERVMHAISRASIYYRLDDLDKAKECLGFAEEMANEFYLGAEMIQTWVLQARLDLQSFAQDKAKLRLAKAEELLKKQFHLISDNKGFLLRDLYETKIRADLDASNPGLAFQDWERLERLVYFRNFKRGNWEFQNSQNEYIRFESDWKDLKQNYQRYQITLETRGDIKKEESSLSQAANTVSGSLKLLRSKLPDRATFLDPFGLIVEDVLSAGELEASLLESKGSVYAKIRINGGVAFHTFKDEAKAVEGLPLLAEWQKAKKIILDPGNTALGDRFSEKFSGLRFKTAAVVQKQKEKWLPKTIASFQELPAGIPYRKVDFGNWRDILEDSDILISSFPEIKGDSYFGERIQDRIELRDVFTKEHGLKAVILTYIKKPNWSQIRKASVALLGSGVEAVYICSQAGPCVTEILSEIRNGKESKLGIRFGSLPEKGGDRDQDADRLYARARQRERSGKYKEAFADLHSARSFASAGSALSLKIESDLLRIYRYLKPEFSLEKIYSLKYEKRTPEQEKELGFTLCLARLLETEDKGCPKVPLPSPKDPILDAISSLKMGKDPRDALDRAVSADQYDPFLYRLRIVDLAIESYFPEIALGQLDFAKSNISNEEDSDRWKESSNRVRKQIALLEEKEEWTEQENSPQVELRESERNYASRLLLLQHRKRSGHRVSPLSLYSEIHSSPVYLFQTLSSNERSQVLDILRYSLAEETNGEMAEFLEGFVEYENSKGNLPRQARITLEFAKAYFSRGDYERAKLWISKIDKNAIGRQDAEIAYLKFKLDAVEGRKLQSFSDPRFADLVDAYLDAATQKSKDLLDCVNSWVKAHKKQELTPKQRRELNDFITYLQVLAFQKNDSETFFDLVLAKEKISSVRSITLGRKPSYADLPIFRPISFELEEKIPENQEFLILADLGLQTFYVRFSKGKSKGDLAFKDNRRIKAAITRYNEEVEKGGSEVLLREALETEIRQGMKFAKNKMTYLYLTSSYFLAPILPKSEEEIYYVADPESLLRNPFHKEKEEFQNNFGIVTWDGVSAPDWYQQLLKLENMELYPRGNISLSPFHIFRDPLVLDPEKGIQFGNRSISDPKGSPVSGVWMLSSSFLDELRNASSNLKDSLYYMAKYWKGPGVVNLGFQTDTHNSRFLKEISSRKEDSRTTLRNRFLKTMDVMKEQYPTDKYWNGYRLFTNSFITKD
ncbi:translocation protein TolB [Leptospira langatensis]|uniref:Translocation protein TolB n=1 Tax=Leptospira langatensis TaxID=2484983 RepID=A0A5F1ZW72_9LEPT|nr:PD40 domain-containing protein [Leptospira langatensis]TGK00026.1 translocation protein TolB [Leptospira langatensis]TGL42661.1 translocation protein TolB [Leptospira langatensis]